MRCHTVDQYQGDENEVVIVCLTRNNDRGEVGFLRARSRSCVLLSRARRALVLFGNKELMWRAGGTFWRDALQVVEEVQTSIEPDQVS